MEKKMTTWHPTLIRSSKALLTLGFLILILIFSVTLQAHANQEASPETSTKGAIGGIENAETQAIIKWIQRPDIIKGANILSLPDGEPPSTVADDWLCLAGSPVADIHFWGSYLGWQENKPEPDGTPPGVEGFRIQIFSDAPALLPGSFSRPDKLLYQVDINDFNEALVASIKLTDDPEPLFEHKYRYDLNLPRIFWQQRDRIYWLNISALPKEEQFPWGWETSMDRWNDYAVQGWYVTPNNRSWEMVTHPMTQRPVDMSFALNACEGASKWMQFPDMAHGFNFPSFSAPSGSSGADDWLCLDGKPITEVHFWGSYLNFSSVDEELVHWEQQNPGPPLATLPSPPPMASFKLSFHEDVPAGVDQTYSHPGDLLREVVLPSDQVKVRYWDSVPHKDAKGETWWEHKFYYIVHLKQPFEQQQGKIYWLDVGAQPEEEANWFWGWETSQDHWNDNAVTWDGKLWNELGGNFLINFEDLSLGSVYSVGDTFVSNNLPIEVLPFQWSNGVWFNDGRATVVTGGKAGGSGNEIKTNNVNLRIYTPIPISQLSLLFGEYGGNVNIRINGDSGFRNIDNLSELDGQIIAGVKVSVINGFGNDKGSLTLTGLITDFAIGGQEFFVDDIKVDLKVDMAFQLVTLDDTNYCKGDFDRDGDVDGSDLAKFSADFGRTDCFISGDCEGDFDYDGDVDGSDLAKFSANFGRTDCACSLPVTAPLGLKSQKSPFSSAHGRAQRNVNSLPLGEEVIPKRKHKPAR